MILLFEAEKFIVEVCIKIGKKYNSKTFCFLKMISLLFNSKTFIFNKTSHLLKLKCFDNNLFQSCKNIDNYSITISYKMYPSKCIKCIKKFSGNKTCTFFLKLKFFICNSLIYNMLSKKYSFINNSKTKHY